jgi:hypothetical protein
VRIPYVREIGAVLALASFLGYTAWVYRLGGTSARLECSQNETAQLKAQRAATEKWQKIAYEQEQALQKANAAAGEAYEKGKKDAESASRAVVSGLRSGAIRLRKQWEGCQAGRVSDAAARSAESDAAARDREESAGRIVRAAREADELIRALQQLLRDERK